MNTPTDLCAYCKPAPIAWPTPVTMPPWSAPVIEEIEDGEQKVWWLARAANDAKGNVPADDVDDDLDLGADDDLDADAFDLGTDEIDLEAGSEVPRDAFGSGDDVPARNTNGVEPAADLGEWDAGDDTVMPPPRGWLLGNIFARKFMSSVLADGGVGKTAVRYAQLLSLAIGQPLTGEYVFQRCRVLIISLEDDADELRRRILALMLHYKIDRSQLKGWLFLCAPGAAGGKLMTIDQNGRSTRGSLAANIEAVVIKRKIDIVSIDPFVKSHSVEENSNSIIDDVTQVLVDLAIKHNIAVDSPHHTSKGLADPGNANRGRGASAMKDAARLVYTLAPMSPDEAQAFGTKEEERRQLIRMDSGKVNITPSLSSARWFRLVGVSIGNGTELYPNGDEVQAVEPWEPPATWAGVSDPLVERVIAAIDAGLPDGNRYTDAPNVKDRAAWRVVQANIPDKAETQAREIIKTWVEKGVLVSRDYENPKTGKSVKGLWPNPVRGARPDELPF